MSTEEYEVASQKNLLLVIIQQFLLAGSLIVVFYLFSRQYIGKPLVNLHDSIDKISHNEVLGYDEGLPDNEIKAVAKMFASVYNTLTDYQDNLEEKVDKRTEALKLVNDQLKTEIKSRIKIEVQLTEAKQNADKANAEKSVFLSHITHELRTPLNGIIGYAQILGRMDLDSSTREYITHIDRCGEHLLTLINNILDFNKIEAGASELNKETLNLWTCLENVRSITEQKARSKGLGFVLEFDEHVPHMVIGDEGKLKQVLINLVGNAIKFTKKGQVTIRVGLVASGNIQFSVEDTGLGVKAEDQDKIFSPFRQSVSSTSKEASTGLGLSISKNLIELMGGEITLESGFGRGSRFYFDVYLPTDDKAIEEKNTAEPSGLENTTGVKILIVDDVLDNRVILSSRLKGLGFTVEDVEGAELAYQSIEKSQPNLIFMDIEMPEINGLEATKAILSMYPDIHIVAFTASIHYEELVKHEEGHFFKDYLYKPVHDKNLLLCLSKLLDLPIIYQKEKSLAKDSELTIEDMIEVFEQLPLDIKETFKMHQYAGNMSKIRKAAKEISSLDEKYSKFSVRLQSLAQHYQLETLNKIIINNGSDSL